MSACSCSTSSRTRLRSRSCYSARKRASFAANSSDMRVWVLEALIADLPSVFMEVAILSSRARRSSLAFSLSDRKRIFWGLERLEDELASLELFSFGFWALTILKSGRGISHWNSASWTAMGLGRGDSGKRGVGCSSVRTGRLRMW